MKRSSRSGSHMVEIKMKITKRQPRRIIKEEKRKILLEQGDPISDELLGTFVISLQDALLAISADPADAHRLGSREEYEESVYQVVEEVEDFVRKRLGDLYAGDVREQLR